MQLKLVLKDGTEFIGESFGAEVEIAGEVVFSTGMVGYPESLTDPSFKDQILVLTYPLVGNYGVPEKKIDSNGIPINFESDQIHIKGLIVTDYSTKHSHYQARKSLSHWLKENNIPAITGIDTRKLTKLIREKGSLPGAIVKTSHKGKIVLSDPNKENLVAKVSCKEVKEYGEGEKTILLVDCGMKNNILRNILKRKVKVIQVPYNFDFINTELQYDAIFLSNGPGDPAKMQDLVELIKKAIAKKIPVIGICLGVQLLAIAIGAKTYKLKFGHRSQNQPCIDTTTNKAYLTSQNHGFAVDEKTLPKDFIVWFKNANDNSVEGIKHKTLPYAAVQFHPESEPGPTDTNYIFDELINLIK